jgi:hypothetical protein
MHLVAIGGSDAGISAALRARELDPSTDVTVIVADAYPNFSICGIPYYISGEVTHWRNLAHRTHADLEATGMQLRLDTVATMIDVPGRRVAGRGRHGVTSWLDYDELVVGTGAVPVRAPIEGLDRLGVDDGVHLLHSMGDTFALTHSLDTLQPETALIVGAGYVGLEMAEGLTARGLRVTQVEMLPGSCPPSTSNSAHSCTPNSTGTAWPCTPAPRSPRSPAPTAARRGCTCRAPARTTSPLRGTSTSSWSWSGFAPTPTCSPPPGREPDRAAPCSSTRPWPAACRTCGRRVIASPPTTACSA